MKRRVLDWLEWAAKKIGDIFSHGGGAAGRAATRQVIETLERDARRWQKVADQYKAEDKMTEMAAAFVAAEDALNEARRLRTSIGE